MCWCAQGEVLSLAIELPGTGQVIGEAVLKWLSGEHRQGEVGYLLHPDHEGRGYATEAAAAMLRLGFEDLGPPRIVGSLDARNTGSARVLERLGMRKEALFADCLGQARGWMSFLRDDRAGVAARAARAAAQLSLTARRGQRPGIARAASPRRPAPPAAGPPRPARSRTARRRRSAPAAGPSGRSRPGQPGDDHRRGQQPDAEMLPMVPANTEDR